MLSVIKKNIKKQARKLGITRFFKIYVKNCIGNPKDTVSHSTTPIQSKCMKIYKSDLRNKK